MLSNYLTVKAEGEHEIVIDRSRFITTVARVQTEEEAIAVIQRVKKQHSSANHNCSAYLIGETDHIQKANDDGEPSGTAGVPMLEVLKKRQLKDTVAVVTRYFGGIKLGAGGLIRAYGKSVSETLNAVGVVERKLMYNVSAVIDYTLLGKVENELRSSIYEIKEIHYLENVEIITYVADGELEPFKEFITNLTNGQAQLTVGDTEYLEELYS
ncbi:hypothetical protein A374_01709 [Fictibacillus macauensis ZFHKF-1]|uniref:YigZ family protein n=1 Tax=Fictibacillus macauensis ZFHKF-1 TaxID=1196324 RepID=I8J550_9BACL|nr:YigZ family protein [Fictibacillus macauensis]EIT86931.1 hypothetical protein A374_01709 [Fictibacillus macauensis ZFHKF-1]